MLESLIPSNTTTETDTGAGTTADTTATENTPTYSYADGIEGQGDIPEWFKADKYKTVSDQAQAYTELESRFGAFTGAPKDGKYEIEGVDFEENPLMGLVAEWGLENQLSTDGLGALVERVNQLATQQIESDQAAAKEALGSNADQRIASLAEWGKNNLSTEEFTQFQGLAQNAGQVEILEKIIGKTKNSTLVDKTQVDTSTSKDDKLAELRKAQTATDEKGRRLMDVDMAYRKKVQADLKELLGN